MSWLGGSQPFVKHASTTHVAFRPFTQAYSREISGTVAAESKLKVSWGFVQNCLNFSFWMLVFLSLCVLWFCIFFLCAFVFIFVFQCFHDCISVFVFSCFCFWVFVPVFSCLCFWIFVFLCLCFCVFIFVFLSYICVIVSTWYKFMYHLYKRRPGYYFCLKTSQSVFMMIYFTIFKSFICLCLLFPQCLLPISILEYLSDFIRACFCYRVLYIMRCSMCIFRHSESSFVVCVT